MCIPPQNFGWRYGGISVNQCEFHQGVDITKLNSGTVNESTSVHSMFTNESDILIQREVSGCGKTVQLLWGYEYVTYMHLSEYNANQYQGGKCSGASIVGKVGETGTSAVHLHIQVCNSSIIYPYNNIERAQFLDPLRFFF